MMASLQGQAVIVVGSTSGKGLAVRTVVVWAQFDPLA